MGYERYPRNPDRDYGRDANSTSNNSYSGARDDQAVSAFDRDRDREAYGPRNYGNSPYGHRDRLQDRDRGLTGYDQPRSQQRYGRDEYHGSYGSDGRRFEDVGNRRDADDDNRSGGYDRDRQQARGYGRSPQGHEYDDRGFFARAGDEVRSWFGDEDAEQRREADMRYDERSYGARSSTDRDGDYGNWRSGQIAALDRDYEEYRREHRSKFENEFSTWRSGRQTQRDSLGKVEEHMDVVGSDDNHVGTVDKVRGDRILLTKSDEDANGRHHSIPSGWIATVDTKVTLAKTADEAKRHWRDEERNQALFGDHDDGDRDTGRDAQGRILNKSFSGTY